MARGKIIAGAGINNALLAGGIAGNSERMLAIL
jgi:hypothetical protein